jgi:hypothetical protein
LAELADRLAKLSFLRSGMIFFMPFSPDELPDFLYHANGDYTSVTSEPGKALVALPQSYKTFWNIVVNATNDTIPLPDCYAPDGRGYFPRASNTPGTTQGDAIRNIQGILETIVAKQHIDNHTGPFYTAETFYANNRYQSIVDNAWDRIKPGIDASLCVPTANENRPISLGLTPAVLLI